LIGYRSNRDAVGAKVYFYEGGHIGNPNYLLGLRTVQAGTGLASTNSKVVHFGTGEYESIDFQIVFPSGITIQREKVSPGSSLKVEELQGTQKNILLLKRQLARAYRSGAFLLELFAYLGFLVLTIFNLKKTKIERAFWCSLVPFGVIGLFRFLLCGYPLIIRLGFPMILGVFSYLIIVQRIQQRLKQKELDEVTDRFWNELIQFRHGDWGRSNVNQLLFCAENIDLETQKDKQIRGILPRAINTYIQFTYPAIKRIVQLARNSQEGKSVVNQIEQSGLRIYKYLEKIKNAIQLNERLATKDFGDLAYQIRQLKKSIDQLTIEVEKKYQCNIFDFLHSLKKTHTSVGRLKIDWQMETIPTVTVRIRPSELISIIDNIIQNVKMATLVQTQPRLSIFGEKKEERFLLHFVDNGCGIPKDKMEKIFENGYTSSDQPGKGKGLFFSKFILKKYGGDIYVEHSEIGKGTEFVVELVIID